MRPLNQLMNDELIIKRIQIFLIVLFSVLILWDFLLALDCLDENTISNVIQNRVDSGLLVLTYFWGAVCANLFFPLKKQPKVNPIVGTIILYGIALLFVVLNAEQEFNKLLSVDLYKYGSYMAFGLIIGLLFWRQKEHV